MTCQECHQHSDRPDEPFDAVSMEIKDDKSTSLDVMFRLFTGAEVLQGDNAYECGECSKKVCVWVCLGCVWLATECGSGVLSSFECGPTLADDSLEADVHQTPTERSGDCL